MRRPPVVATAVVLLAVAAMIALGVWQLRRREEKAAAVALIAGNVARPPVAFPLSAIGDGLLFRRSEVTCRGVANLRRLSGRDAAGAAGWRIVVDCPTDARAAPVAVQLGIADRPDAVPAFRGGRVAGFLSHAPDGRSLIERALAPAPRRLMLVADTPVPGLRPNAPPDPAAVPDNHLAYAVQWFAFAAIALGVYALALRRRWARHS